MKRALDGKSPGRTCTAALAFSAIVIILAGCLHKSPLRRESLISEIDGAAATLSRDTSSFNAIKDRKVGTSGYFYVIDREGTILYHPQGALAGMSFAAIPMVQRILDKKEGCMSQYFEGMEKIVLFRPAGAGRILCLTISKRDIEGDIGECEEMK